LKSSTLTSSQTLKQLWRNHRLYIMLLPGIFFFFIFKYIPMGGLLIAFMDYQPFLGFTGSEWVGFKHFKRLFTEPIFWDLFRNTMILAIYNIVFFFPLPIILALLLNELRSVLFKRTIQTLIYVPHFISWVVVVGLGYIFLSTHDGIVNGFIEIMGFSKIEFLTSEQWFRTVVIGEIIWKESGWGTIIFLAALAGIDPQLYEASRIDGANRWRQIWHITLPGIRSTILILFILRLGQFLDTGFEQIYLMLNALNRGVGEVFDTYVYVVGITEGQFSYSTTVGLFKSFIALVLVVIANYLTKKFGDEGLY
jgi:putative aldouronate transport system permease protein